MKTTILFFMTFFLLASCSKDNPTSSQLPLETQTGANTFGCYINGKLLIPRDGTGTIGGSDRAIHYWGDPTGSKQFNEIDFRDYKSYRTAQILIHIQNLHQIGAGNYTVDLSNGFSSLDGLNQNYIHCRIFNESTNSYQYYRSFDNCGTIVITIYDFQNNVLSGTFTCRLRNSTNPVDEIQVSQGRFDINPLTILDKVFP
jgi:hypothetical protein